MSTRTILADHDIPRQWYNLAADLAMKIRNSDLRIRETLLYGKNN